ncbi:hypothetical protein ACE2AK_22540 [Rahnella perminowiae]|uniref:hypothetical protein n=1 Tax=Rahnella TaxID=34037 RepID=UPI001C26F855|nr:hypothetical protein [Rahnella aceris]MBU9852051.1 hypothetical protein [Rahnella aceris]
MNNKTRLRAENRAFMERVVFVSFLIGIAFFAAGCLWAYFASIWFDATMQDPAMHQYALAFSLVLHLPAWVCGALGGGAMFASLMAVAMALLEAFMRWAEVRVSPLFRVQSVEERGEREQNTAKREHHP